MRKPIKNMTREELIKEYRNLQEQYKKINRQITDEEYINIEIRMSRIERKLYRNYGSID